MDQMFYCIFYVLMLISWMKCDDLSQQVAEDSTGVEENQCDWRGSDSSPNSTLEGQCKCKRNVIGKNCSQCKSDSFDLNGAHKSGCLQCFCFGKTKFCESAKWFQESLSLTFEKDTIEVDLVFKNLSSVCHNCSSLRSNGNSSEVYVDNLPANPDQTFFWKLPKQFLGDKLSSYGGFINFTINYKVGNNGNMTNKWLKEPLVFIQGKGVTLFYRFRKVSRNVTSHHLPLVENTWLKLREDNPLDSLGRNVRQMKRKRKRAKRRELLTVLSGIDFILIKANYKGNVEKVGMTDVKMSSATPNGTSNKTVTVVEKCQCPDGYEGLSCQYCAPGFTKGTKRSGHRPTKSAHECRPCQCNGHSEECNRDTGKCFNCQHNTTGYYCERSTLPCDERGTLVISSHKPHCQCKARVFGELCDRCSTGNFFLDPENPKGCQKCWCSGVTFKCSSSKLRRFRVQLQTQPYINIHYFNGASNKWSHRPVKVMNGRARFHKKYKSFTGLHWSLPRAFTGHLLKSYGGYLNFSVYNYGLSCPRKMELYPFLEIRSFSGVHLWWKFKPMLRTDIPNSFSVKFTENHFVFCNTTVQSYRNNFLSVLSSVKSINIYAPECPQMTSEIGNIVMDTGAEGRLVESNPSALEVEQCQCPFEYSGLSCEFCAKGFIRDPATRRCIRKRNYWQ